MEKIKQLKLDENKVVLGLSGGVDSTAAALILQQKGYKVIGLYFNVHAEDKEKKELGIEKAKKISEELGIKLIIKDLEKEFSKCVIGNFIEEYSNGRTPNPCIMCNPNIKFKTLIDVANQENAFHIATGHYAQIKYSNIQNSKVIAMGENKDKDQSYMLYRLPKEYVERLILPLGTTTEKSITRNFVKSHEISNHDAKDSQEICFIDDNSTYIDYLEKNNVEDKKGFFIDAEGNILGEHKGISHYTIGQRKGLGIALGKPAFVINIDENTNNIILGNNEDLFSKECYICDCHFTETDSNNLPEMFIGKEVFCKVRYKAKLSRCILERISDDIYKIKFEDKQRALTPGQSAVLYCNEEVIGGGFIRK